MTFTVPNMGIDPLTVKAKTVNTGGRESSEATSDQVQPYGPTPDANNAQRDGQQADRHLAMEPPATTGAPSTASR